MVTQATDGNELESPLGMEGQGDATGLPEPAADASVAPASTGDGQPAAGTGSPAGQQVPDELKRLREENARFVQAAQEFQIQRQNQAIDLATEEFTKYLTGQLVTNQGYDETTATTLAKSVAEAQASKYIAKQALHRLKTIELSAQYHIPVEQLENFTDERSMLHFAQTYSQTAGPQAKRIAELEKQVARLMGSTVPAQQYDNGGRLGAGRGNAKNYMERLRTGKPLPPAAEIDRMTAEYLRG